jgi:hypothetical protein
LGDRSGVKRSLQTFAVYLKGETPWTGDEREVYQFMEHKVWTHEIVRTHCLQTGTVTVVLKR